MPHNRSAVRGVATQFATFATFGAVSTVVQYAILIVLVQLGAAPPPLASGTGFTAGAVVNYILNRRFTFRSNVRHGVALPRFVSVAAGGLLLNTLVLTALIWLRWHYITAQVFATCIVLGWNFGLNRSWTFGSGPRAKQ